MKSDKLKASAKNNTVKDFEFSYFDDIDDALIEGLEQNQDFFSLLLNDEEIKREVKELEKEIRDLGGAISIAEQVKAGTYVQELVSKENIHRNADILPNGVFKL